MAITDISITQDNIVNGSNLLPIHSVLSFIADVTYTGTTPDVIHVEIYDDTSTLLDTWKAIPYRDLTTAIRQFAFIANDPIKGVMEGFDDDFQLDGTFEYVEDITKVITIRFVDPDASTMYDEVEVNIIHGASQFGSNPNFDEIFNNDEDDYYAAEDNIVYVYFYNDAADNVVSVNEDVIVENYAVDYNDDQFVDYNDDDFTILTT